jgi:uncharacterized RDD family membrane protein YckC
MGLANPPADGLGNAPVRAPGLKRRLACLVYEFMVLFGIGLIPGAIGALIVAQTGPNHPTQNELVLQAIGFVFYGCYFVWFWSVRGQTLPMQTWHIRVVTTAGQPLTRRRALARYVASYVWLVPAALIAKLNHWPPRDMAIGIGVGIVAYALLALLQPQRQYWHDMLCGTQLIDAKPAPRTKP